MYCVVVESGSCCGCVVVAAEQFMCCASHVLGDVPFDWAEHDHAELGALALKLAVVLGVQAAAQRVVPLCCVAHSEKHAACSFEEQSLALWQGLGTLWRGLAKSPGRSTLVATCLLCTCFKQTADQAGSLPAVCNDHQRLSLHEVLVSVFWCADQQRGCVCSKNNNG